MQDGRMRFTDPAHEPYHPLRVAIALAMGATMITAMFVGWAWNRLRVRF